MRRCCGGKGGTVAELYREDPAEPYVLICCTCARDIGCLHYRVAEQLAKWLAAGKISPIAVLQDSSIRP